MDNSRLFELQQAYYCQVINDNKDLSDADFQQLIEAESEYLKEGNYDIIDVPEEDLNNFYGLCPKVLERLDDNKDEIVSKTLEFLTQLA
jgi:uncharacterized protein YbcC (UPF0753/DUF2309 family)